MQEKCMEKGLNKNIGNIFKKMEIYDTIFKREIDNIPCIELIKECEIKYLENINLQRRWILTVCNRHLQRNMC